MTIENHSFDDEPSRLPKWLVIVGILVGAALIGIGMWVDRLTGS